MPDWPSDRLIRRLLFTIALSGLVTGAVFWFFGQTFWAQSIWALSTLPVIVGLAISIVRDLAAGRFGVDAIALLSMTGALLLGENLAGVVVAIMYSGGNLLEDYAVGRAERDLKSLIDRAPRIAHRYTGRQVEDIAVDKIAVGDRLLVRAGEIIPVDGILTSEVGAVDEAAVTGEPLPVIRQRNAPLRSGSVNAGETFDMTASAVAGESTYAAIVRMVTAAQATKAPFIRVADRFDLALVPATLTLAGAAWFFSGDAVRALAVLVASTPCPLILAAPVAFIAGVSRAARGGILIKGSSALESLAHTHTVMFDKTGTLTVGGARLAAIETAPHFSSDDVLRFVGSLEQASHNVVAGAIVAAARARSITLIVPENVREAMGSGIEGRVAGKLVKAGSDRFVFGHGRLPSWAVRALRRASWRSALSIFVSVDEQPIGALLLADELRRESPRAIQALRTSGVKRIVMVTGDRADAAETIGAALDIDAVLADRVPSDKVEAVAVERRLHPTTMVGDGINDAPALAAADVGVAMGARGASASSEAADVVVLVDRLDRVADAVSIARRAYRIALQSIVIGLVLSGIAMIAAAFGMLSPVAGAVSQELIDVAVILNALRALSPGRSIGQGGLAPSSIRALEQDHETLNETLNRLREIADKLDDASKDIAVSLIAEAYQIVSKRIVEHEREDEMVVYPRLNRSLGSNPALAAMSRAHREILHLARLLSRLSDDMIVESVDRYFIRDAQRIIESLEALVRMHNAQEEDIYEHASS
jgi:heavy metal translocating P-type ATPase